MTTELCFFYRSQRRSYLQEQVSVATCRTFPGRLCRAYSAVEGFGSETHDSPTEEFPLSESVPTLTSYSIPL